MFVNTNKNIVLKTRIERKQIFRTPRTEQEPKKYVCSYIPDPGYGLNFSVLKFRHFKGSNSGFTLNLRLQIKNLSIVNGPCPSKSTTKKLCFDLLIFFILKDKR